MLKSQFGLAPEDHHQLTSGYLHMEQYLQVVDQALFIQDLHLVCPHQNAFHYSVLSS